jgi:transposase-like protein
MKRYVMNCPYCGKMLPLGFWHEEEIDDGRKNIKCPRCGKFKPLKDGFRQIKTGKAQRYYCTGCGYRFTNRKSL